MRHCHTWSLDGSSSSTTALCSTAGLGAVGPTGASRQVGASTGSSTTKAPAVVTRWNHQRAKRLFLGREVNVGYCVEDEGFWHGAGIPL
jgi:hypothetical protein